MNFIYIKKSIWIICQEGWNIPNLENQRVLHFEFQCQILFTLYHNTYILLSCTIYLQKRGLWFDRTHLPLFWNMPVKIYTIFFLSSGGCNFKLIYLKDKMRDRMSAHILLNNLTSSPLQHEHWFWHRRLECYQKSVKFYPWTLKFIFETIPQVWLLLVSKIPCTSITVIT